MIKSFADKKTEKLFKRHPLHGFPLNIEKSALRKLIQLHTISNLQELRIPPANRLESLKGNRKNQYSIRVNDQWRLCFRWENGDAFEVEIIDYH